MTESSSSSEPVFNSSAGHLSVHLDGAHAAEVPFLFEQQAKRLPAAFAVSFVLEVGVVILFVFAARLGYRQATAVTNLFDTPSNHIIWIAQEGPGGGGGGGGNKMKELPRKAEVPGKEKISVPVTKPPALEAPKQQAKAEPDPVPQLNIPAKLMGSSTESLPGLVDAPAAPSFSQGSGSGGGAGTGTGTGVGPGSGSGLGPGSGGGTGGGVYRPGSGITSPEALVKGKPAYTPEAMRARIQGSVMVECVVQPNGTCTDIQVVRSLDPTFGLDQEAVKSVRAWRFKPGTRLGQAVPVLVTIEVAFTLR